MLKKCNLIDVRSKVVLEKPLGFSLASSKEIHSKISKSFNENLLQNLNILSLFFVYLWSFQARAQNLQQNDVKHFTST